MKNPKSAKQVLQEMKAKGLRVEKGSDRTNDLTAEGFSQYEAQKIAQPRPYKKGKQKGWKPKYARFKYKGYFDQEHKRSEYSTFSLDAQPYYLQGVKKYYTNEQEGAIKMRRHIDDILAKDGNMNVIVWLTFDATKDTDKDLYRFTVAKYFPFKEPVTLFPYMRYKPLPNGGQAVDIEHLAKLKATLEEVFCTHLRNGANPLDMKLEDYIYTIETLRDRFGKTF